MQQIAVLASLTSVPPGLRANENSFVKTSFQNMALHPSSRPTTGSLPNALMGGSLSLASHEYETDGQDSFFADISSLSSSLMAKDGSTDNNDMRPILPLGSAQKVSGGSYDSLLMGNGIGLEGSGHLLLSLGGGEYPRGQSLSSGDLSPTPLRILKRPVPATGPPSESSAGGSTDDPDEAAALLAAQHERSQFPPEFINKLVAVLKKYGSHGLLGSQFPDVYKKLYGEKLVLENKKGND